MPSNVFKLLTSIAKGDRYRECAANNLAGDPMFFDIQ
jgi:hypothetical protein